MRHLAPEALETPALAFGQAVRELMNMSEIVADMLRGIAEPLLENQRDKCDVIVAEDDKVDLLNREIRFYLARLGSDRMTPAQGNRRMQLINVCSDLEGVGDVITRSLVPLARKKADQGVNFSEEGRKELDALLDQVGEAFDTAVSAFATSDEELGRRAQRLVDHITQEEERLRRNHIERLQRERARHARLELDSPRRAQRSRRHRRDAALADRGRGTAADVRGGSRLRWKIATSLTSLQCFRQNIRNLGRANRLWKPLEGISMRRRAAWLALVVSVLSTGCMAHSNE